MTFLQRAIGAASLDVAAYEDVEADRHATRQALAMVVLSSAAGGIGVGSSISDAPVLTRVFLALVLWIFWAALTCAIGLYLTPEADTESNVGELLRTIGFASSPGTLRIGGFVPIVGPIIYGVATGWMLVTMVVAVRQALDYKSTARAVVVCVVAGLIAMAMTALAGGVLFVVAEEFSR
jgi:hypothetical protein